MGDGFAVTVGIGVNVGVGVGVGVGAVVVSVHANADTNKLKIIVTKIAFLITYTCCTSIGSQLTNCLMLEIFYCEICTCARRLASHPSDTA